MDFTIEFASRKVLEFYEEDHIYLVDGIIVPSVSQILDFRFGHKYDAVSPAVLARAAERGTGVHASIERFCKEGIDDGSKELRNFKFLQGKYGFHVQASELPVIIEYDGLIAAGRFDLQIVMDGQYGGADVKSVSALDKERTAYQLNLYRIGVKQCYGTEWKFLKAIHLKDDVRKIVDLPIAEDEAKKLLKEYKEKQDELMR